MNTTGHHFQNYSGHWKAQELNLTFLCETAPEHNRRYTVVFCAMIAGRTVSLCSVDCFKMIVGLRQLLYPSCELESPGWGKDSFIQRMVPSRALPLLDMIADAKNIWQHNGEQKIHLSSGHSIRRVCMCQIISAQECIRILYACGHIWAGDC